MSTDAQRIEVQLVDGPLPAPAAWHPREAGAVVAFDGVVRPTENGRALDELCYEVYEPMTSEQLRRLADDVLTRFELVALRVQHSVGYVAAGACSFRLRVAGAHRKEALGAMDAFIDAMKRDVPIWKCPVWREATDDDDVKPTGPLRERSEH